ncbi:MAG: glycosyltransferase family 9 protein [candidate division KSB1 bacterium]|nr:glycosyltransferase family 9 protein [candidate division KSB1 bacterium]MDZ7358213.1 glycosyltransferase family 9 protein [candidate division KSB1 bacterium]MDZ7399647.1 glycosyltransferase family 9 protein [candidate division KSB1 bacterium]
MIWHQSRKLTFRFISKLLFWLPTREINLIEIKRVLVIIVGKYGIGDVVLCTPALRLLSEHFGAKSISVLIDQKNTHVLDNCPLFEHLFIFNNRSKLRKLFSMIKLAKQLRQCHFDIAIDFYSYQGINSALLAVLSGARHRIGRDTDHRGFFFTKKLPPAPPQQHQIDRVSELLYPIGLDKVTSQPEFFIFQKDQKRVERLLNDLGIENNKPFIIIHPGTGNYISQARQWPLQRFAQLADRIIERYAIDLLFTGSGAEIGMVEIIQSAMKHQAYSVAGKCSLQELAALIQRAQLFISGNTGPMHIAVAVGTSTVSIFTHIDPDDHPERWKPRGTNHIVIQKDVGCKVCDRRRCRSFRCLYDLSVDDVFQGVNELINRTWGINIWSNQGS